MITKRPISARGFNSQLNLCQAQGRTVAGLVPRFSGHTTAQPKFLRDPEYVASKTVKTVKEKGKKED